MSGLNGKVAVVTGGAGGIGTVIMKGLAEEGATVVCLDIQNADIHCDVRSDESVRDALAEVVKKHGRIDIAVHAAGISRDAVAWKLSVDDWDLVQQINLRGAFLLIRHAVPAMRDYRYRVLLDSCRDELAYDGRVGGHLSPPHK